MFGKRGLARPVFVNRQDTLPARVRAFYRYPPFSCTFFTDAILEARERRRAKGARRPILLRCRGTPLGSGACRLCSRATRKELRSVVRRAEPAPQTLEKATSAHVFPRRETEREGRSKLFLRALPPVWFVPSSATHPPVSSPSGKPTCLSSKSSKSRPPTSRRRRPRWSPTSPTPTRP